MVVIAVQNFCIADTDDRVNIIICSFTNNNIYYKHTYILYLLVHRKHTYIVYNKYYIVHAQSLILISARRT